jgi:hypothetical protein
MPESKLAQITVYLDIEPEADTVNVRLEVLEEPLMASILDDSQHDKGLLWSAIANGVRDYHGLEHRHSETPFTLLQKRVAEIENKLSEVKIDD